MRTLVPLGESEGSYTVGVEAILVPELSKDPEELAFIVFEYGDEDVYETEDGSEVYVYFFETWERFYITVVNDNDVNVDVTIDFPELENFHVVRALDDDIRDEPTETTEEVNQIVVSLGGGEYQTRYLEVNEIGTFANPGDFYVEVTE